MRVICIEGPHGIGKSTLCSELRKMGKCVLDEAFMDSMPEFAADQMTRQMAWVCDWVKRVYDAAQEHDTVFVDRSPFSSAMYNESSEDRKSMIRVIESIITELKECHDIHIRSCLLICDSDETHWAAVTRRLETEPERHEFKEGDRGHFQRMIDRYSQEYSYLWEYRSMSPLCSGSVEELLQSVKS